MQRYEERRVRHYVQVIASMDVDGRMLPRCVVWDDGRSWPVDEVLDVRRESSTKAGGCGERYLVRIGTDVKKLYCEGRRWFVEAKVDQAPC